MDLIILISVATGFLIVLFTLFFIQKSKSAEKQALHQGRAAAVGGIVPQRAQIVRNQRNRLRQNAAVNRGAAAALAHHVDNNNDEEAEEVGEIPQGQVLDEKMGTKKRAKLEAKEQKRLIREQDLKQREERKAKEAKEEEVRRRQEELEAEDVKKKEEVERLAREERERKEQEEYLKMKEAFSVEEEGFEGNTAEEKDSLLLNFVQYIKDNKVVVLEDLAQEFKLRTQEVIDRIHEMQTNGTLTGVIDDRGKFIYISEDELKSVAKFIKQRGRVSIAELAASSNNLISLVPVTTA